MVGHLHANEGKECSPSHQYIRIALMGAVMRISKRGSIPKWQVPPLMPKAAHQRECAVVDLKVTGYGMYLPARFVYPHKLCILKPPACSDQLMMHTA
jgi:hypothetical protein